MTRWKWHEKPGVRKGHIKRKSDYMTPEEEELRDYERHCIECLDQTPLHVSEMHAIDDLRAAGVPFVIDRSRKEGPPVRVLRQTPDENLLTCSICGGQYLEDYKEIHDAWHSINSNGHPQPSKA